MSARLGRPPRPDDPRPITVRIPPDAAAILAAAVRDRRVSRSMAATALVEAAPDIAVPAIRRGPSVSMSLGLSRAAHDRIDALAASTGATRTAIITAILRAAP